jgi:hypothetical protein
MPTPFESAQLILTLYDQRREATLRKAREFWATFNPQTEQEFAAAMFGPEGAYIRMVLGYWDMAASLVENGAIDRKMFQDSTSEYLMVYTKIEALLPQLREKFANPGFLAHLEKLTFSLPDARSQIDSMAARIKGMMAARAAAQTTSA